MTRAETAARPANGQANGDDVRKGPGPLLRPTGRTRTAIFLGVNLLGYAFANMFLNYLATGQWITWRVEQLAESMGRPLGYTLIQPLSIFTHPWLMLVFGLLLAVVVIVPLLVACLYHSRACVAFLVCVPLLGAAPLLTLAIGAGCVLVAVTALRRKAPMLSILLGLAPVAVYLYFACTRWPLLMQDMQRLLLYVPFAIAVLAAVAFAAVVLLIAKLIGYRPGAVWPVMAVLLASPAWLFFDKIGRDELQFALIHHQISAPDGLLEELPLEEWLEQARPDLRGASELRQVLLGAGELSQSPEAFDQARQIVQTELDRRKRRVVARCDRFLRRWPESDRVAGVLWVRGMAIDTQLSVRALQQSMVRFTDDAPAQGADDARRSAENWRRLAERFPADPRAGIADYRLALLELRPDPLAEAAPTTQADAQLLDRIARAETLLQSAEALLADSSRPDDPAGMTDAPVGLLGREMTVPAPDAFYEALRRVRELRWLMRVNHVAASAENAEAFMHLVALDDELFTHAGYVRRLRQLRTEYAETTLRDNLALAEAMSYTDLVYRTRALLALEDVPGADASIAANYELGKLAARAWPSLYDEGLQQPEVYFRRVAEVAIDNPWKPESAEQLAKLLLRRPGSTTTRSTGP